MTTSKVVELLESAHQPDEWVTYREAWRIDLLALRCREGGPGYRRVGYEVKVGRGDFRSELLHPDKRAGALELTHQLYFACPSGLIQGDEVPPECGLVWVSEGNVFPYVVKPAPIREPRAFSDREIVYLARFPWYRERLRDSAAELLWLQREVDKLGGRPYPGRVTDNQGAAARL